MSNRTKAEILAEVKTLGGMPAQAKADPSTQFKQVEIEVLLDIRDALLCIAESRSDADDAHIREIAQSVFGSIIRSARERSEGPGGDGLAVGSR